MSLVGDAGDPSCETPTGRRVAVMADPIDVGRHRIARRGAPARRRHPADENEATTMRHTVLVALTIAGLAAVVPESHVEAQSGWTTLFDGTSLKGWNRVGDANWEIVDGAVQATKGSASFLVTPNSYADFQITLEFWASDD